MFNDPKTVSLFVRDNQHIPAVLRSHYKLIYICNMYTTNTLVKKMNKYSSNTGKFSINSIGSVYKQQLSTDSDHESPSDYEK